MQNEYQQNEGYRGYPGGYHGFFPVWLIPIGVGLMMSFMIRRRMFGMAHHHGAWGHGVPPMFLEWHRRAHESQPLGPAQSA